MKTLGLYSILSIELTHNWHKDISRLAGVAVPKEFITNGLC